MSFKHKLSRRLAMLKDAWLIAALAAVGCEKPLAPTDANLSIRLQIVPKSLTMPVAGATELVAVALTSAGDSTTMPVNWSATSGSIVDTRVSGDRHYASYQAAANVGVYQVIASGDGSVSATPDTATVTVVAVRVATVTVAPAVASVGAGTTVQLSVTAADSAGNVLVNRATAWVSSNTSVATVSGTGMVSGVAPGSATITATSEGQSGTAAITVAAAPPPASGIPDPTLLPRATGQAPNVVAYTALNLPSRPAGFSYNDPVSGVKIWKVTSGATPAANSGAGHDYADEIGRAHV